MTASTPGTTPDQRSEKKFVRSFRRLFLRQLQRDAEGKETPAQMEKYTIVSVSKVKDDLWLRPASI